MDKNADILKNALSSMPVYEPENKIWESLAGKLDEKPLKDALGQLPEHQPEDMLWELIANKMPSKKSYFIWWYAAAMAIFCIGTGWWAFYENNHQVSFSQQVLDSRLQGEGAQQTNQQYALLKAYCETETLICNSKDYRQLQQEYEKLDDASRQLRQAMGAFNTEAGLVKQFDMIEEQKAEVLNEMAKMI